MLQNIYQHYIQPIRTFNRDARLFMWATVINGIILSGWQLFFNIYMLQSGFSREFLGIINSLPSLTALLLGIPMGRISDRIGRKTTLIATLLLMGIATFLVALVPTYESIGIWGAVLLTVLRFIQGVGVGG